jgi:hypothetical protein
MLVLYNTCHETGVIPVRIVPILMEITNALLVKLITRKIVDYRKTTPISIRFV